MRNQQAAVCRTTAVAAVTEKMVSLPTFIKMEIVNGGLTTDWTLALLEYLGGLDSYGTEMSLDNAPWGLIFGKGSGMVSCLPKRVKYQLLQEKPF